MRIRPLQDWIVVEQDPEEEFSAGGLIIPDTARQKQEQGTVKAIGEGKFVHEESKRGKREKNKTFVKTTLRPGDRILYEPYAKREIDIEGESYVMVREEAVLGLL